MLTGGTGDQNLLPECKDEENQEDVLSRVRSLLVFSVENQGPRIDPRSSLRKADVMMERWKAIFTKYDAEGDGTLTLKNIRQMVRKDLKISERLVTDDQIQALFFYIDRNGSETVDFYEFLSFVQQPSTRGAVSEESVVKSVARGVRLCVMRNKIRIKDLEANFYSFDVSGDVATGELGVNDMVRFFRKVLGLTKHECSDKALRTAFHAMDDDMSGKMSLVELMDFIKFCTEAHERKELPIRVPGLISGMRGQLPERLPSRRPGMSPGSPRSTLPFCLNGRSIASAGRLAQTTSNFLSRSASEPAMPSLHKSAVTMLSKTMSAMDFLEAGSEGLGEDDILSPTAASRSPQKSHNNGKESPKKRAWSGQLPGKTRGGYMLLNGAQALNQVEDRLFASGIDVRGHYHKLGRFRPEYHTAQQQ